MNEIRPSGKGITKSRIFLIIGIVLVLIAILYGVSIIASNSRWAGTGDPEGIEQAEATELLAGTGLPDRKGLSDRTELPEETEFAEAMKLPEGDDIATTDDSKDPKITQIISSMSTEEKVAQLFIITPEALTGVENVTQAGERTKEALRERPVGGLIYFRNNLKTPEQVKELTGNTKLYGEEVLKLPLILSIDEEGGKVTRLGGRDEFDVESFPNMAQVGAEGDPQRAYEVGTAIGGYLAEYGFTMDFAPNADVLTNPDNKVIGDRSFGTEPELVWSMSGMVSKGLREQGIQPVYKHFPGHGATKGDTHEGFAYTDKTLEDLLKAELVPFIKAIQSGEDCIMAAHIAAPNVTGDENPASLSYTLITEVLREKLGYQGVVITDALNMGAISNLYSSDQAAIMAINAGVDILLMPDDFEIAYEAVLKAVNEGTITQERLDQSIMRISEMKLKWR